jgi:nucleotide-binding universal stress UspA family protein
MLAIRKILHPTDFSERSEYAFRMAYSLARDHGSSLLVLHVVPVEPVVYGEMILPPRDVNYQELKDKLLGLHGPDGCVRVERRLEEGRPAEEIVRVAEESHCDLIVMGTHGRTGLQRLLVGSVAEQVMRKGPCPVLTVKTPFPDSAVPSSPPVEESVTI